MGKWRKGAPCSIPGCGRVYASRGWCRMHYDRWCRSGDPLGPARVRCRGCGEEFRPAHNNIACEACRKRLGAWNLNPSSERLRKERAERRAALSEAKAARSSRLFVAGLWLVSHFRVVRVFEPSTRGVATAVRTDGSLGPRWYVCRKCGGRRYRNGAGGPGSCSGCTPSALPSYVTENSWNRRIRTYAEQNGLSLDEARCVFAARREFRGLQSRALREEYFARTGSRTRSCRTCLKDLPLERFSAGGGRLDSECNGCANRANRRRRSRNGVPVREAEADRA
jgi:hypothetical protein